MKEYVKTKEFVDADGHKRTVLVWGGLIIRKWRRAIKLSNVIANVGSGAIWAEDKGYQLISPEFNPNRKIKELLVGWAICQEDDEFNLDKGLKIAKSRAKTDDAIITQNGKFLKEDMINAILELEMNYIGEHPEKYLFSKNK